MFPPSSLTPPGFCDIPQCPSFSSDFEQFLLVGPDQTRPVKSHHKTKESSSPAISGSVFLAPLDSLLLIALFFFSSPSPSLSLYKTRVSDFGPLRLGCIPLLLLPPLFFPLFPLSFSTDPPSPSLPPYPQSFSLEIKLGNIFRPQQPLPPPPPFSRHREGRKSLHSLLAPFFLTPYLICLRQLFVESLFPLIPPSINRFLDQFTSFSPLEYFFPFPVTSEISLAGLMMSS